MLSFDILDNLARSGVNHDDQQPAHLRVKPAKKDVAETGPEVADTSSLEVYAGPEQRFCPAKVYEYQPNPAKGGKMELIINAQNCVHCKCCSIKTADEFIKWTVPEGGGGPQYAAM